MYVVGFLLFCGCRKMNTYLNLLDADQRKTLGDIRRRKVVPHHYLDWRVFEELGAREAMEAAICAFSWLRLLCLAEPVYQELLWEFYSTFEHFRTHAGAHGNAIQFRLGGEFYSLSYDDFGRALGLLPPFPCHLAIEELDSPIFRDQQFFERICLPEFAGAVFTPGHTTATQLRPEWRIINQLLGKSYTPSEGSTSHLQLRTLHCLHSMSHEVDNLHLSSLIARTVAKHKRCNRRLACGPVVTALARYYNVDLSWFTVIQEATPFSRETLRRQLILERDGNVVWIRGLPCPVPRAPEGEEPPEASNAAARRTTRRTRTRPTPSAPGDSTSGAGPSDHLFLTVVYASSSGYQNVR
ncbi:unnamed protein product [Linum trigynum]|uniref:Uncharacterized protein n=1 Tax=Linum trigynum TaxID=586398 RepID=A0AAV2ES25_9ROSI